MNPNRLRVDRTGVLLPILFWIILTVLAAGQSAAESSRIPPPMHACTLLPTADVAELVGGPVDEPRETHKEFKSAHSWMSMCNYYNAQKQFSLGITLKTHGNAAGGAEAYKAHEAGMKETLGPAYKLDPVSGIGDRAGWDESSRQLTIFQGPLMLIVGVVSPKLSAGPALEFCKQVAGKVLPQLPNP